MRRTVLLLASAILAMLSTSGVALAAPTNDNFASPTTLTPALTEYGTDYGQPVQASNFGATRESGEPAFGPYATTPDPGPYMTVWYKWTADADGRMSIYDLGAGCGQYLNASVGVYTGDALGSLTRVTDGTRYCYDSVAFDAIKGTTYRIQVGSVYSDDYGTFRFGWSFDRSDNDGDGVLDGPDECENEPAATASGCPEADLHLDPFVVFKEDNTVGTDVSYNFSVINEGPNTARKVEAYMSFPKGAAVFSDNPYPSGCDTGTDSTGSNTYVSCPVRNLTSRDATQVAFHLIFTRAGDFTLTTAEVNSNTVRDPDNSNNVMNTADREAWTVTVEPSTDTERPTGKRMAAEASPSGTGAALGTDLTATFSEEMRPDTIDASSLQLFKCPAKDSPPAKCTTQITNVAVELNTDPTSANHRLKATLDPFGNSTKKLQANTKYKVVATTSAKDMSGNRLDQNPNAAGSQDWVKTFTTGSS